MGKSAAFDEGAGQRKPNPLFRRTLATGVAGVELTASSFLGAGIASAAAPALIESCTGTTGSSEYGQPIEASPSALDDKVEQATLLAYPLRFDLAKQARQEFRSTGSVPLGSVTEKTRTFSGETLAGAFASHITSLSTIKEHSDEVNTHVRDLAIVGCLGGARVSGQAPPPPPPSSQPERPTSKPAPSTSPSVGRDHAGSPPPSPPPSTPDAYPAGTVPAAVNAVPPDWAYLPGTLPPWAQQVPGLGPDVGGLRAQPPDQRKQARDDEVRAAGNAESMPADVSKRVALPVLIAAIALAIVTAALVRTWVLRRN